MSQMANFKIPLGFRFSLSCELGKRHLKGESVWLAKAEAEAVAVTVEMRPTSATEKTGKAIGESNGGKLPYTPSK